MVAHAHVPIRRDLTGARARRERERDTSTCFESSRLQVLVLAAPRWNLARPSDSGRVGPGGQASPLEVRRTQRALQLHPRRQLHRHRQRARCGHGATARWHQNYIGSLDSSGRGQRGVRDVSLLSYSARGGSKGLEVEGNPPSQTESSSPRMPFARSGFRIPGPEPERTRKQLSVLLWLGMGMGSDAEADVDVEWHGGARKVARHDSSHLTSELRARSR